MQLNTQHIESRDPIRIFFSYSHKDQRYRDRLETHLSIFKRTHNVECWHDRKIGPGQDWAGQIHEHLDSANIILLLISADFIASDYCWDVEMQRAMTRQEKGEAVVIPIIIRPTLWRSTPFSHLQALPQDGKALTDWKKQDSAYVNIAQGLKSVLLGINEQMPEPQEKRITWQLLLDGITNDFTPTRLNEITRHLRKLSRDITVSLRGHESGSVKLNLESTQPGYEAVREHFENGSLSETIGVTVKELSHTIGATLRIEAREVGVEVESSHNQLPKGRLVHSIGKGSSPLLKVMLFPPDDPQQIQFGLDTENLTETENADLVARLGRYFTTCLVVRPEDQNVNLSPYEENNGLPKALQRTELGRDLLAQDFLLKQFTATLLHPNTEAGNAFWEKYLSRKDGPGNKVETYLRVWIVPGRASIKEKMVDGQGCIILEDLQPQVMCATEYQALAHERGGVEATDMDDTNDPDLMIFKELILPIIQEEVATGKNFGLLRQMLSAMAMAAWFRQKYHEHIKGFFDTNRTADYGLDVVKPDSMIQEEYLKLFHEGVWRCIHQRFDVESAEVIKHLYVVGGISGVGEH